MIRYKKPGEMIPFVGYMLGPFVTCEGTVEVWDQTLGCPACGCELWTGKTYEGVFYIEHPFVIDDAHDAGDEGKDAWNTIGGYIPFGGWRFPSYPPAWHNIGYSYPGYRPYETPTEHVFPVDMQTNHDPGDEA